MTQLVLQIMQLQEAKEELDMIRSMTKTEGGRLSALGQELMRTCIKKSVPQSQISKLLGVSTAAVSQQAAKIRAQEAEKAKPSPVDAKLRQLTPLQVAKTRPRTMSVVDDKIDWPE